jgi:hypothetical protein
MRGETYQTRPKAPMPTGCRSVYLMRGQSGCEDNGSAESDKSYLLVISKVVPKIWARTNSAMVAVRSQRVESAMMSWWIGDKSIASWRCRCEEFAADRYQGLGGCGKFRPDGTERRKQAVTGVRGGE